MTIKSDKWIRRMAQEHGMIEPFVERQVRGADDSRVISYGVSSYGYDALRRRIQGVHQHPFGGGRSEELRREKLRRHQQRRLHHPAEPSPWRAPSSTSASRATS